MEKFDDIIIGFGKAGKTLAVYLANKNKKVAVIEEDETMYGGTCINVGCIPTKYLVHKSMFSREFDTFKQKANYYNKSILEKKAFIKKLNNVNYHKLADNQNIKIYLGKGSFIDKNTIEINGKERIFGETIYINTGSTSFIPNIKGLNKSKYIYTSNTLLNLEKLPKELVIIGGGNIGLEFANIYANFGSKVTILSNEATFMAREDDDVSSSVFESLNSKGISIELGLSINKISSKKVEYEVNGIKEIVSGDAILVATGRIPNTKDLKLDNAKVLTNNRGGIVVDKNLRTNVENIYALGDCNGGLQFTYVSLDDFRIIKSHLEGGEYNIDKRINVPYSIFIEPSLGRVGLNEKQVKDKNLDFKILRVEMKTHPKAKILEDDRGFIKILVDNKTHYILGASLLCEEAYELVNYIKLAMDNNIPYEKIVNTIYTHPTMSEAFNDLK